MFMAPRLAACRNTAGLPDRTRSGDKLDAILQFGKPTDDGGRQFSFTGSL
jgi:hypothetical protein